MDNSHTKEKPRILNRLLKSHFKERISLNLQKDLIYKKKITQSQIRKSVDHKNVFAKFINLNETRKDALDNYIERIKQRKPEIKNKRKAQLDTIKNILVNKNNNRNNKTIYALQKNLLNSNSKLNQSDLTQKTKPVSFFKVKKIKKENSNNEATKKEITERPKNIEGNRSKNGLAKRYNSQDYSSYKKTSSLLDKLKGTIKKSILKDSSIFTRKVTKNKNRVVFKTKNQIISYRTFEAVRKKQDGDHDIKIKGCFCLF